MATRSPISGPRLNTVAFQTSGNEEIDLIWARVQATVTALAGGDTKIQKTLDKQGVLQLLDQAQTAQDRAGEKYRGIKNVFAKTLNCISHVGGIVAAGASNAFAPANMCFNAITFVIVAWQDYEAVFEGLSELLSSCAEFLDRLANYIAGGMDIQLTKVACQHLQLFVDICQRTIELRHSKRAKIKIAAKLLFMRDDDIQGLLGMMKKLVDKENNLVSAQTFKLSSAAAQNSSENLALSRQMAESLQEDRTEQKRDKDTERKRKAIFDALAFDEDQGDSVKKEPKKVWEAKFKFHRDLVSRISGTGSWIFEDPLFKAWIKAEPTSKSILAIEGDEGSGKSCLASTVIHHLRDRRFAGESGSRTATAFYFLDSSSKDRTKNLTDLELLAKATVWQLTQADASFENSVFKICENVKFMDPGEIWKELLLENEDRGKIGVTFFIVVDGLDFLTDEFSKFLQSLSLEDENRGIRLFVTGRSFQGLKEAGNITFDTIRLSDHNQSDIIRYIDYTMDSIEALKDTTRLEIPETRTKIRNELVEKTAGDYFKLDTSLKKIDELTSLDEIDEVLANAGRARSDQIVAEIKHLNQIRSPREIEEINEIIMWISAGYVGLTPVQMEAVLYLKNGKPSLLSLESKIKTRYTLFIVNEEGNVDWKFPEVLEHIPQRSQTGEDRRIFEAKEIHPSELELVNHMLHAICPTQIYDKFGFDEFFEKLRNRTGERICIDWKNDHFQMALNCLKILTAERDERIRLLLPYARMSLPHHLKSADLSAAGMDEKATAVELLCQTFSQIKYIDTLFWDDDPESDNFPSHSCRAAWQYDDNGINAVLEWCKEPQALSRVSDKATVTWIEALQSETDPKDDLLKPTAKRLATHLFQGKPSESLHWHAFYFLFWFLSKMRNRKNKSKERITDYRAPTFAQIRQIENWAQQALGVEVKNSLWECQVGHTLARFNFDIAAEQRLNEALRLDENNWRASLCLTGLIKSDSRAVEILAPVTDRLSKDSNSLQDPDTRKQLSILYCTLGDRYWKLENFESGIEAYERSLEFDLTDYGQVIKIIGNYGRKQRWTAIMSVLKMLEKTQSRRENHLLEITNLYSNYAELHDSAVQAAIETDNLDFLDNMYTKAIEISCKRHEHQDTCYLRYCYGVLHTYIPDGQTKAIETFEATLREDYPRSPAFWRENLMERFIKVLAPEYLAKALATEPESTGCKEYLHRLDSLFLDNEIESKTIFPAKLFTARYYHLRNNMVKAKEAAQGTVTLALEMLSDDDPDNDEVAYWRLVSLFLAFHDDVNLFAAFTMIGAAHEAQFETERDSGGIYRVPAKTPAVEEDENTNPSQESPDPQKSGDAAHEQREPVLPTVDQAEVTNGVAEEQEEEAKSSPADPTSTADETKTTEEIVPNGAPIVDEATAGTESDTEDDETLEKIDTKPTIPTLEEQHRYFGSAAVCAGGCDSEFFNAGKLWICRDCIAILDDECYHKVKDGTLFRRICHPAHEHVYVPEWEADKMKALPKTSVPVGDRVITLEEWKAEIKLRYL